MKDLKFKITDEMINIIIEVLMINQILKQNLNKRETITLINQKNKLVKSFIKEFQKNGGTFTYNELNNIKFKNILEP